MRFKALAAAVRMRCCRSPIRAVPAVVEFETGNFRVRLESRF